MTPAQRAKRNALERAYLADLRGRVLRAACPRCKRRGGRPCVHDTGPRRGSEMAGYHGERAARANVLGYVRGPRYWRHRRS